MDEVALFLNDGVARIFDVTQQTRDPKRVLSWFAFACIQRIASSRADVANGFAGARGVLSYGERVLLGEEMQFLSNYLVGSVEAHNRFGGKICVYSPKEFQLNLAFSRAYIIESGGRKKGLEHAALYVDQVVLDALENLVNDVSSKELAEQDFDPATGGGNKVLEVERRYTIERRQEKDLLKMSVSQKTGDHCEQVAEFIFALPEILFSDERSGIVTKVHRLVRVVADNELIQGVTSLDSFS